MKKALLLVLVGLAGVAACGGGTGEAPKTLRYALIPKALGIPVFDYARIGGERAAQQLGVEVIYRGPDRADQLRQKEILESFITQKVDGIAISVLDASFLTATIDRAVEAGIPVVTWDSDAPDSKRAAFYGVDDYKSGLVMGEETARMLGGKGTVAFITAPARENKKTVGNFFRCIRDSNRIDTGERGATGDCCQKIFKLLPTGKNLHFTTEIFNGTRNSQVAGLCVNKRAETDSLNNSTNCDSARFLHDCAAKFY